jgi:hypothetical protein
MFYRSGWLRCDVVNGIGIKYIVYVLSWCDVLTPHVLSEWMVEVCGKYLYPVYVLKVELVDGDLCFELV